MVINVALLLRPTKALTSILSVIIGAVVAADVMEMDEDTSGVAKQEMLEEFERRKKVGRLIVCVCVISVYVVMECTVIIYGDIVP